MHIYIIQSLGISTLKSSFYQIKYVQEDNSIILMPVKIKKQFTKYMYRK